MTSSVTIELAVAVATTLGQIGLVITLRWSSRPMIRSNNWLIGRGEDPTGGIAVQPVVGCCEESVEFKLASPPTKLVDG